MNRFIFHLSVLCLSLLACGTISVMLGKELSWDLANYHFYNPYAFLHTRNQQDFWPTSFIHQYINPTIDFLTYFLIKNFSPAQAEFILGCIHGSNFWLLFCIAKYYVQQKQQTWLALLLAAIGLYGANTLTAIGSFHNDAFVSIFILGFVLLQLRVVHAIELKQKYLTTVFLSGLCLGLALGLKLTASIFVIGALLTLCCLPIHYKTRCNIFVVTGLAMTIGLLVTSGYWMLLMWQQHSNPVFPFLNGLFHSPDFAAHNWRDTRFLPHGLWQQLFFPFYFSLDSRTSDSPFFDLRFSIVYLLFVFAICTTLWKKFYRQQRIKIHLLNWWLFSFFIFSYLIWQFYFSIARYLLCLAMLSPLVIYLLLQKTIADNVLRKIFISSIFCLFLSSIFCIFIFLLFPTMIPRARWYTTDFFNIKFPDFIQTIPQADVLITYPVLVTIDPRPQSYLIPYFPPNWRFIGVPFAGKQYVADKKTNESIRNQIVNSHSKIFILTTDFTLPSLYKLAATFDLLPAGNCTTITSDRQYLTFQDVLLCPMQKVQIRK